MAGRTILFKTNAQKQQLGLEHNTILPASRSSIFRGLDGVGGVSRMDRTPYHKKSRVLVTRLLMRRQRKAPRLPAALSSVVQLYAVNEDICCSSQAHFQLLSRFLQFRVLLNRLLHRL